MKMCQQITISLFPYAAHILCPPEHIIPVLFDKVDFMEGYVEFVTHKASVLSVMVCCAMTRLIGQVPVCHERSNHIESCTQQNF